MCGIGLCPAIYEVTPKEMKCAPSGFCPEIYEEREEGFYIICE